MKIKPVNELDIDKIISDTENNLPKITVLKNEKPITKLKTIPSEKSEGNCFVRFFKKVVGCVLTKEVKVTKDF